jgi:hypothetical protein
MDKGDKDDPTSPNRKEQKIEIKIFAKHPKSY